MCYKIQISQLQLIECVLIKFREKNHTIGDLFLCDLSHLCKKIGINEYENFRGFRK
jgi:hypothetical protein